MIGRITIVITIILFALPTMGKPDNDKFLELFDQYENEYQASNYTSSISILEESLLYVHPDSLSYLSQVYNGFSLNYMQMGQYQKAIDYGRKALEYDQQIGDSCNISLSLALLAAIFTHQHQYSDAEHYMRDALKMVPYNDSVMLAARYATLGEILNVQYKCDEAYDYIRKAYIIDSTAQRAAKAAIRLSQLGTTLLNMGNYTKAADVLAQASDELKACGNISSLCINMIVQTKLYIKLNKKREAERIADECLHLSDSTNQRRIKLEAMKILATLRQSPELFTQVLDLNDSIYNEQIQNQIAEFEVKYAKAEADKAAIEERIKRESDRQIFEAQKSRMYVIIASLLVLVIVIIRMLRIKYKANAELSEKNSLLAEQKTEIEAQRDTIKSQSEEIQASINYARRIQHSLLTPDETISRIFPEHFLLYKPRNIVSGDYYWVGQFGDDKVCIVADCTGHGVPGGFMSVLGISNLNYIVSRDVSPDMILNHLREAIINNLRQTNNLYSVPYDNAEFNMALIRNFDGMDAAVYVVNEKQMTLTFAGANNPLVLIRDNEIKVLKGDRMPVGIYARIRPFTCTTINLQHGDCIYTFSDGFQDQFANENQYKFTARRLHNLLLEIHQLPMDKQREQLNRIFEEWRGPSSNQTDDVVIMGVRI